MEEDYRTLESRNRKDAVEITHLRTMLEKKDRNMFDLHKTVYKKFEPYYTRKFPGVSHNLFIRSFPAWTGQLADVY